MDQREKARKQLMKMTPTQKDSVISYDYRKQYAKVKFLTNEVARISKRLEMEDTQRNLDIPPVLTFETMMDGLILAQRDLKGSSLFKSAIPMHKFIAEFAEREFWWEETQLALGLSDEGMFEHIENSIQCLRAMSGALHSALNNLQAMLSMERKEVLCGFKD